MSCVCVSVCAARRETVVVVGTAVGNLLTSDSDTVLLVTPHTPTESSVADDALLGMNGCNAEDIIRCFEHSDDDVDIGIDVACLIDALAECK